MLDIEWNSENFRSYNKFVSWCPKLIPVFNNFLSFLWSISLKRHKRITTQLFWDYESVVWTKASFHPFFFLPAAWKFSTRIMRETKNVCLKKIISTWRKTLLLKFEHQPSSFCWFRFSNLNVRAHAVFYFIISSRRG